MAKAYWSPVILGLYVIYYHFGFRFVSFAPILFSISPTPALNHKSNAIEKLIETSPLGCAMFVPSVFSAQFGRRRLWGGSGLSLEISLFVATFYIGAVFLQYPIGWLSDRMDRRRLIMSCAIEPLGLLLRFLWGKFHLVIGFGLHCRGNVEPALFFTDRTYQ